MFRQVCAFTALTVPKHIAVRFYRFKLRGRASCDDREHGMILCEGDVYGEQKSAADTGI